MDLLHDLPSVFDRLMSGREDRAFVSPHEDRRHFPPLQLCEDEECMRLRALVPGASQDRLSLLLENNTLILRGELSAPKGRHHRRERPTGVFQRVIPLPYAVGEGPVDAVLRDGVLTVTVPKARAEHRRPINVHYAPKVLS